MFNHFLIPTDGSAVSRKAARAGIGLASKLGAKVTIYVAIVDLQPFHAEGYWDREGLDWYEARASAAGLNLVDAIGKVAKLAGVPFTTRVTKAPTPYEGIIGTAKKRKCDVIFMASHGRSAISRLIMGSVTQKVLSHTKLPVVVYR